MHTNETFLKQLSANEVMELQLQAEAAGPLHVEALKEQFERLGIRV